MLFGRAEGGQKPIDVRACETAYDVVFHFLAALASAKTPVAHEMFDHALTDTLLQATETGTLLHDVLRGGFVLSTCSCCLQPVALFSMQYSRRVCRWIR